MPSSVVNNSYLENSKVLYTFVPNKSFAQLLDISHENFTFLKRFDSKFLYIERFTDYRPNFTDQNSNPLEIEGKINIILVVNKSVKNIKITRYSIRPRPIMFVKPYGFLSLAKNMGKSIGKNISKILNSKSSQKLLEHAKKSSTDALKTSAKRLIQKTAEEAGDLVGNRIADKTARDSNTSPQNNSETNEEEILREKYVYPELKQKIIDDLRLKED